MKILLVNVPHVLMIPDLASQIVHVLQDIMMMVVQFVQNAYQNVTNVQVLTTTVVYVILQESLNQNQIAHAQMDNTNSNITVRIVMFNVKHVKLTQESVLHVLETEMVKPIAHVHMDHTMLVKLTAHTVMNHVKPVLMILQLVKFV